MPRPLGRVIHTLGWPLRPGRPLARVRRVVHLPTRRRAGDDRDGGRARLPRLGSLRARPAAGAEDPPADPPILEGGERVEWGAKTIPEGGLLALPRALPRAGSAALRRRRGLVNVPALKGIHYAVESGRLAAEAAWRSLRGVPGGSVLRRGAARVVRLERPPAGAQHAAVVRARLLGRRRAGRARDAPVGRLPARRPADRARRRPADRCAVARRRLSGAGRAAHLRQALLGLPLGQPHPRRPAEPPPGRSARCRASSRSCGRACARPRSTRPATRAPTARRGASCRPRTASSAGRSRAKGGRLTPPEGGSGPEYTLSDR